MPPHIAQLVVGHRDINTTMGYKAVYPEEVINGHRAFIARRRELRPSEEYRTPTDEEWEEFLGHFQRRRLSLGDCGRAYGTSCIHEHSCLRCSLLRPDPAQRPRLIGIRDNLRDRIAEARQQRWLGRSRRPAGQPRRRHQQAGPDRGDHPPPRNSQPRHARIPRHRRPHPCGANTRSSLVQRIVRDRQWRSTAPWRGWRAPGGHHLRSTPARLNRADLFGDWLEHIPVLGDRGLGPDGVGGRRLDAARDVLVQAAVFLADLGFGPTADRPTSALAVGGVAEGDCGYPIAVSLIEGDAVVAVTAARACRMKIVGLGSGLEPADCDKASELVGGTGIEPVTSSVSGKRGWQLAGAGCGATSRSPATSWRDVAWHRGRTAGVGLSLALD